MTFLYNGSWEGLLCVYFQVFNENQSPDAIHVKMSSSVSLFSIGEEVPLIDGHAERVQQKLRKTSPRFLNRLFKIFLSEEAGREMLIYRLIRLQLQDINRALADFRNPDVRLSERIEKKINREVHRMHAFVRFQRTADDLWLAPIQPDFNVMPLIGRHFEKRYADQKWVIYDIKRNYGLYYDLERTEFVEMDFSMNGSLEKLSDEFLHAEEKGYQKLWQNYFESTNIKARKNPKLHLRHVPKRYWRFLYEKHPG